MKKVVIFAAVLLVSCSPVSSDTQVSKKVVPQNGDKVMSSSSLHNAGTWKEFNQLYSAIQAEKNKNTIEMHYKKVEDWQAHWRKADVHADEKKIVSRLFIVLNDEIKRKKEQLRNKPGRQAAVDWFKSIKNHLKRMDVEIEILSSVLPASSDFQENIQLLLQSLQLSTQLIDVDREQILKRHAAGDFELSNDQKELLQAAENSIEKANSILESQVKN